MAERNFNIFSIDAFPCCVYTIFSFSVRTCKNHMKCNSIRPITSLFCCLDTRVIFSKINHTEHTINFDKFDYCFVRTGTNHKNATGENRKNRTNELVVAWWRENVMIHIKRRPTHIPLSDVAPIIRVLTAIRKMAKFELGIIFILRKYLSMSQNCGSIWREKKIKFKRKKFNSKEKTFDLKGKNSF